MATCLTCGEKFDIGPCPRCPPGESQGTVIARRIAIGPKDFAAREIRISWTIMKWKVRAWVRTDSISMPIMDSDLVRARNNISAVLHEHFGGGGFDDCEDKCVILQSVADKLRGIITAIELVDGTGDGLVVYTEWP